MVQRWFDRDLAETPETMARIMTVIAFVRPGDLYGMPIDVNVAAYGHKLMGLNVDNCDVPSNEMMAELAAAFAGGFASSRTEGN